MSSLPREVAADACFLISLLATGRAEQILDCAGLLLVIPPKVRDEVKRSRHALEVLVASGRARFVELPIEAAPFHKTAGTNVDEGEAQAIALGLTLKVELLTDDGCAIDAWVEMARDAGLEALRVRGICEVLQEVETTLAAEYLRESLERIQRDANFDPPREHADWWKRTLSTALPPNQEHGNGVRSR